MQRLPLHVGLGAALTVLATTVFTLALTLPASALTPSQRDGASTIASLSQRIADNRTRIGANAREASRIGRSIRQTRLDLGQSQRQLSQRLVALYTSGDAAALSLVLAGESVGEVVSTLDAMDHVTREDQRLVQRYERAAAQIPKLERRTRALAEENSTLRAQNARLGRQIRELREQARRARAEAARLARQQQSPLVPSIVAPASVLTHTADQIEGVPNPEGDREGEEQSQHAGAAAAAPAPAQPAGYSETGEASVYSTSLAGQPTASGTPYDPGAMTAAHPTLAFGTYVTVSGPGGSAVVLINDRGPFVGGRIIDLSSAAASAVGISGIGQVTITVNN